MGLATEVLTNESSIREEVRDRWDELAVRAGRPFCGPAWMLAWWRNARPDGAGMRVVTVADGDSLVGVAPFWAVREDAHNSRYEILAARLSTPVGPLVAPGREFEVAEGFARALDDMRPKPSLLELEDLTGRHDWAELLSRAWPGGRPWTLRASTRPVPIVSLGTDYETWIAGKSSKFRGESRRLRRRLEDAGANFALAGPGDLDRALQAFEGLHAARWGDRGGSNALVPGMREMFLDAARELLPAGRLRVFTIEAGDDVVAVNILVSAGGEVSGWNSGFDESWSRLSPSLQLTLHALADAAGRGEKRMSLGPGGKEYKLRLADEKDAVQAAILVPRGVAYPLTRLRLMSRQARIEASRRLSPAAKRRLRRLTGSRGGGR
jgi:CelD/BcsL family acetyltransferase involved in cellulose biosynthesis